MRFRRLSLERFGRFEDCELTFRDGTPDLHIVYGANEAGKTTSMAAVSDLLFGFEMRSRYNFRFDYPLLRVGAVLEEDGRVLPVRRRKTNAGSLVDADDKPIDEGPLTAMLHGQTREGFRLAFSLDHLRLREGGQAIVQARDDVGQALFAAGSGMTGITATLAEIDREADEIWAPRAAQRRTYTQAERALETARTVLRDRQVKPKAWIDARDALDAAEVKRIEAEQARDDLLAEQRRVDRLRRIGPAMQRRADLLERLAAEGETPVLSPAREERVLAALDAAARAERERVAADKLLADVTERLSVLPGDDAVLAAAEVIEELAERRGAVMKAAGDAARLAIERRGKDERIAELRREAGVAEDDLPPRVAVARLRDLAKQHGEAGAALRTIAETEADLQSRLAPLQRRLADAELTEGLAELTVAVEAALRLGEDADARCTAATSTAATARSAADAALGRLAPWSGDHEALLRLPSVVEEEIAEAEAQLADARDEAEAATREAERLTEELAQLALRREALADAGQAVSGTELTDARHRRDDLWHELRNDPGDGQALPDVQAAFEDAITSADDLADRRFAFAADSGKLGLLDQQAADLELRRDQAGRRAKDAMARAKDRSETWHTRLIQAGIPVLDPPRLRAWTIDRAAASAANDTALRLLEQAAAEAAKRDAARNTLLAAMPDMLTTGTDLTPVLREGQRRRMEGEKRNAAYQTDHAEMRHLTDAIAAQTRQARHRTQEQERCDQEWGEARAQLGMSLSIAEGGTRLALIDELRAAVDEASALKTRLNGIETDQLRFEADVAAVADRLDQAGPALDDLRKRLEAARLVAATKDLLNKDRLRHAGDLEAAHAHREAAVTELEPVLAQFDGIEIEALDAAVQTSRRVRDLRAALATAEAEATRGGEGHQLAALEEQWRGTDPDAVSARADALEPMLADANARAATAASAAGEARRAFAALDLHGADAAEAAAEVEQYRSEMAVQAETYLLKRAQAVTLRWAIERYRQERQDPLLARASVLFRRLTLDRYGELRIDYEAAAPRLLGVRDGGRQSVDVEAMSDGTADQLFLALRLAAAEQSVAAGVRLPFLADDLFINFDDDRSRAGFEVLAELASTTQVLFFTHHAHLARIAHDVVGAELHSECALKG